MISKFIVHAGWDDVPHLDERTKEELLAGTAVHLRDARSKGLPSLGAGAIYPYEESLVKCDAFDIPAHWARVYGLDIGWNRTAAIWGALDRDNFTLYLYAEHYRGQAEPAVHSSAIKARGEWIPGVIDPAARGRSQKDGEQMLATYISEGLNITPANNSVESGILEMQQMIATGRLKVFPHLTNWFAEYRLYRRDENGKIIKKMDHLMDATRYLVVSGLKRAITRPMKQMQGDSGRFVADRIGGY